MELNKFKQLLENIRKDIDNLKSENPFISYLLFPIEQINQNLTNGYVESHNTYIFEGKDGNATLRLALTFDEKISNVLAMSNPTNEIKKLKLEIKT